MTVIVRVVDDSDGFSMERRSGRPSIAPHASCSLLSALSPNSGLMNLRECADRIRSRHPELLDGFLAIWRMS